MKSKLGIASFLLLAVMVFVPFQSAAASGTVFDGQVIFGQSYTLRSGDTLNGDLMVFGGSATIEEDAKVNGNLVLFGGNLSMNGEVTGDVAVTGGSVALGSQAHIGGNLATVGASLSRADGSEVDGQIYNTATSWITEGSSGSLPQPPIVITPTPLVPEINFNFNPLWAVMDTFGMAIFIAVLAMLLMLFLAPHADRVAHAVIAQPLVAGGLGLLTVVLAPVAFLALVLLSLPLITLIITVPAGFILVVTLGMAMLFGWIALGYEIGQRLTRAFQWNWHPAFSAGLGVFLLTLVVNGASVLNFIPGVQFLTWVLQSLIGLFALGAVVMTRFGTQAVLAPVAQMAVMPSQPTDKKSG